MRRRTVCVLMVATLWIMTMPSVAYADVSWQDQTDRMTAVVAGYPYTETGRCGALMEYLGFDWSTIGSKQRQTLLSDRHRDNPFTQSLSQVHNVQYETNGTLNWPIISLWSTLFGLSEQWDISLSFSQYQNTQEYVRGIITGSGGGGGGGGTQEPETDGDYVVLSFPIWYGTNTADNYYFTIDGTRYYFNAHEPRISSPVYVRIKKTAYESLTAHEGWFIGLYSGGSNNTLSLYLGYVEQGSIDWTLGQNDRTMRYFMFAGSGDANAVWHENVYSLFTYSTNDDVLTLYRDVSTFSLSSHSASQMWSTYPIYAVLGGVTGGGGSNPDPVPTPEPDPPVTPPTPPTGPTFTFDPTIAPSAGDPDLTEITDWLRLIYNEEVDIEVTITEVMNNLGTDLAQWFQQLNNSVTGTVEWAVEEIEFYLDSFAADLFGWLRRIVSRMGGTGVTKPDPTTDQKGFWEWLLERILDFFAGDIVGAVNGLKNKLTELTQLFPFSLPWDLMGLLALFAAQPVTPVFDVPMPVPSSVSGTYGVGLHVDLHQWDGTMVIVRGLEKIFFAAWLITMFPQWLDDMKLGDS